MHMHFIYKIMILWYNILISNDNNLKVNLNQAYL